ncbi:MAG: hypothetical protein H5U14_08710 [Roseovarius sp.]|nr:hypothetical protein [Roseovarius sp.]
MDSAGRVLITIRPGPVLHVWRDGVEVARVPLTIGQGRIVMHDILGHVRWSQ